jgi:hypothetical protein
LQHHSRAPGNNGFAADYCGMASLPTGSV